MHEIDPDEVQTIRMQSTESASSSITQIDAQEDREIVGVDVSLQAIPDNANAEVRGRLWIGTEPDSSDGKQDLGGKFLREYYAQVVVDSTNGVGNAVVDLESASFDVDDPLAFDWNEDSTLNFEVDETAGNGNVTVQATIYYREAHSSGL